MSVELEINRRESTATADCLFQSPKSHAEHISRLHGILIDEMKYFVSCWPDAKDLECKNNFLEDLHRTLVYLELQMKPRHRQNEPVAAAGPATSNLEGEVDESSGQPQRNPQDATDYPSAGSILAQGVPPNVGDKRNRPPPTPLHVVSPLTDHEKSKETQDPFIRRPLSNTWQNNRGDPDGAASSEEPHWKHQEFRRNYTAIEPINKDTPRYQPSPEHPPVHSTWYPHQYDPYSRYERHYPYPPRATKDDSLGPRSYRGPPAPDNRSVSNTNRQQRQQQQEERSKLRLARYHSQRYYHSKTDGGHDYYPHEHNVAPLISPLNRDREKYDHPSLSPGGRTRLWTRPEPKQRENYSGASTSARKRHAEDDGADRLEIDSRPSKRGKKD